MALAPEKAFLNDRLTFRLNILAEEAIAANDAIFTREIGAPIRDIRVLRLIEDHPGTSFVEICAATGLERSRASRILQRLLGLGWIRREGAPEDARRYRLFATEAGQAARQQARRLSDELEAILTRPLAEGELAALKSMLDRLALWVRDPAYRTELEERGGG